MKLTKRQRWGLRRIAGDHAISPDLARQLIKKGLAIKHDVYERKEWNKVVATLWVCCLTSTGQTALDEGSHEQ